MNLPYGKMNDMRTVVYESEIVDEYNVCQYCGDQWSEREDVYGCCGEVHQELAYELDNGEVLMADECRVLKGDRPLTDEQKQGRADELAYELGAGK